jgi:hypothetical protein
MKSDKVVVVLTVLSLLVMALAGCTGGNTTPTATTPPSVTTPPGDTTPPVYTIPTTLPPPPSRPSPLVSISVSPDFLTVSTGVVCYFGVKAHYEDGVVLDVTKYCDYESTDDYVAYVVTKDAPGLKPGDPIVPGWYIQVGPVGSVRINISYTENGITRTTFLPISIERLLGGS